MARTCTFSWQSETGKAEWSFDGEALLLVPDEVPPRGFSLRECSALSGDGHAIALAFSGQTLSLQRLGQDGPSLLESLWRLWPPARAGALRLSGSGEPRRFRGALLEAAAPKPCELLLYEDLLVAAEEGSDLQPLFLSLLQRITFDETSYAVTLHGWDGRAVRVGKMAGETQAFLEAVKFARAGLVREAAEVAAAHLPGLSAAARAALSAVWLPGRMVAAADLEKACPGFGAAFEASWLSASLRKREGRLLLGWAGGEGTWLGYGRPGLGLGAGTAEEEPAEAGAQAPEDGEESRREAPDCLLWMLCGRGGAWLLETLSEQGHATYRFEGGEEMPHLASRLLCAPQFSREALYLPIERLAGERADLAVAARELGFLRELRARFKGRAIHAGLDRWKREAGVEG